MKTLDELEKEAHELDEALGENNDESEKIEPAERKMRFEADNPLAMPDIFISRTVKPDMTLEQLALARTILESRDAILPDELEQRFQNLASKAKKYTMTTGGTGTGAELVDTLLWNQLFRDMISDTLVADLFRPFVPMGSGKMELSEGLGDVTFRKPAREGHAVTATDLATAKRSFNAYLLKAQVDVSDEEDEDAIIAMIPEVRTKLVQNAREVIDSVILNADSTGASANINKYGAAVDGDEQYLLGFDGLIHYALVEDAGTNWHTDLSTLATADFATLLGLMGKYADKPRRVAFILDRGVHLKACQLSDFTTVDKMGDKATLLTGQVAQVWGVPVILSSQLAKSDANGRIDGAVSGNNTLGRIIAVNRDMWRVGFRRSIKVATERNEAKGLTSIVATLRMALQAFGDRSSAKYAHTVLGYNVTI